MARSKEKIQKLLEKSKEIFYDCLLPNGCLVAAPSHMPYYPAQAKSYLFCWPGRDSGFNLTGALHLGIDSFDEVLTWIWERAEDYQTSLSKWKEGLLFRSYHPHGRIREARFQPDQTGTLLWAIGEYHKKHELSKLQKQILRKSGDGLANLWEEGQFKLFIEDPWEERIAHPRFKTHLTYSLAACASGLSSAHKILPHRKWNRVAREMGRLVEKKAYDKGVGYFLRRFGGEIETKDYNIDASMLGLVWPFAIVKAIDRRMVSTVEKIEERLVDDLGVHRYQFDEYEGEIEAGDLHYKQGAGVWPLLTFWLSIVLSKMGERGKAEKYFWLVLDQLDDDFLIPEQLFPKGDPRIGVKPLLWSHMMFVHAAYELGFLKQQD